jgi:D-alanyl-D-alanine carboxypeptidase
MISKTKHLAPAVVLSVLLAVPASAAPLSFPTPPTEGPPQGGRPPEVSAPAWVLFDETVDVVLASVRPNDERAMASITKIMTGLLAIENSEPGDLVTVSEQAAATGEKEIDLYAGETITMDALFKTLMIHSANDSATAIAEHIGGSVEEFVVMMNERAIELGMRDTSFANPHGLDAPNHYSSARDLLTLVRIAMEDAYFVEVVRATIVVIPPAPDGTERIGTTTNLMLAGGEEREGFPAVEPYEGNIGVKTGFTAQAQHAFVAAAERAGRRLYVVLLGSEGPRAHFSEAERLLDYGFEAFPFNGPVALSTSYVSAKPRVEPDPILVQSDSETFVHLAGQGLTLPDPIPRIETGSNGPTPFPITTVSRSADFGPRSVLEIITFWLDRVLAAG